MKSIRIVSDGLGGPGTKVFDAETGQQIHGIRSIEWSVGVDTIATAKLEFVVAEVDVKAETLQDVTALSEEYRRYIRQ